MAPELIDRLESTNARERARAALELAHAHPPGAVPALLARLARETDAIATAALCVALEMIGDPSAVPDLKRILERAPPEQVWDVAHALGRLTGVAPLVDIDADPEQRRSTWLSALGTAPQPPAVVQVREHPDHVTFAVDHGTGRVRIDYAHPAHAETNWPRWDRALFVGDVPLYSIGSTCGTCETILRLAGWPERRVFETARELASAMEVAVAPSKAWVEQWSPILGQLSTGNYLVTTVRLAVERVDQPSHSWQTLRRRFRDVDENEENEIEPVTDWPGAAHYQGPAFPGTQPTYWTVLPSQPLAALSDARVAHYQARLAAGDAPTVLALGWVEDRYVQAEWDERFVALILLDGHHKLEAYAREGRAANLAIVFSINNSWGPPGDRTKFILEAVAQARESPGVAARSFG